MVAPVPRSELLGQKLGRSDSQIDDTLSTRLRLGNRAGTS
jgi:hypothetical protein